MKVVLDHVTKIFPPIKGKGPDVVAVDDFDYEIPDGKLIGLLGPSGCGKSTTLYMICGLESPTKGRILFGDDDVTNLPTENRGIGLVFQNYALYPHMTVLENIIFPLQNAPKKNRLKKEEMLKKAEEVAKLVQIDGLMERKPSELSGGQQQRVAIARALVKTPNVLLLDEPLSNLDARLRLQTREEIRRIQRETGITTIFVTHDQEEAMSISDIIVVMKKGRMYQYGKPQDVYDLPVNLFVAQFLGTPPINVFDGRIEKGLLYIGDEAVLKVAGDEAYDREVIIGVRPEGCDPSPDGNLTCKLLNIEVMGRDVSVVSSHGKSRNETIRNIIDADEAPDASKGYVKYILKPHKVHVFDIESEKRLEIEKSNL